MFDTKDLWSVAYLKVGSKSVILVQISDIAMFVWLTIAVGNAYLRFG